VVQQHQPRALTPTKEGPMQSVQVITDQRDPNTVQLFAIGLDASVAAISGSIQSTWWLLVDVARQLCHDLGAKLLPTVEGGTE
jgi:hypothetical protein